MTQQSDIEIYVADLLIESLETWLVTLFNPITEENCSGRAIKYRTSYQGEEFAIVIVNNAAHNFSSVWFNSPNLPWTTDIECAKCAYKYFKTEIRCVESGWQEGQDPDQWYSISAKGERMIVWRN